MNCFIVILFIAREKKEKKTGKRLFQYILYCIMLDSNIKRSLYIYIENRDIKRGGFSNVQIRMYIYILITCKRRKNTEFHG